MHNNVLSKEGGIEAGDTNLTADNSAKKIAWFDCYDLNDHGRMEIDYFYVRSRGWSRHHVLAGLPISALRTEQLHSSWHKNALNSYNIV